MTGEEAPRAERVANDVYLLLISRISMAGMIPMLGFLGWLMSGWMQDQETATLAVAARVSSVEDTTEVLTGRVIVLETNSLRGRADREEFQSQMIAELRDMRATIGLLSNRLAALDATIQAMRDRADAGSVAPAAVVR